MALEHDIIAHASFHFEDLQLSSKEFYHAVEDQLKYYEYPSLHTSRVSLSGSSWFVGREYLCVQYNEYRFYICAAPFGKSYFVSWWLKRQPGFWARFFKNRMRKTLYQQDTEDLFLQSVKKIIEALVEKVNIDKGFLNKD